MADTMTLAEREIKEKRAKVWDGMRAIMDKMSQGIAISEADRAEFDKRNKKLTDLDGDLRRIQEYNAVSRSASDAKDERDDAPPQTESREMDKVYERAFVKFLRNGHTDGMDDEERKVFRTFSNPQTIVRPPTTRDYSNPYTDSHGRDRAVGYSQFRTSDIMWDQEERATLDSNALSTAPNSAGVSAGSTGYDAGYMIPQGFWHNLQIALKAYGGLLPYIQMLQTDNGQPMPWPTVDPTSIMGRYITEQNQLGFGGDSNGTDYQFGQGMLNAWTIVSGVILASVQLINDSAFDVDGFVNDRIGESIGRKVAGELHTGTGSSAILGIETALNARGHQASPGMGGLYLSGSATNWAATHGGAAWSLYQTTTGTGDTSALKLANALIGFDDILGMIMTVDPAYRKSGRCTFVANDLTLAMLRTITDAMGRPIWSPNVVPDQPDSLYGYPVIIDQNTSSVSTTASTNGGLLFGDFKVAMVGRQVNGATMLRLTERYADYLQVGYLGYVRMDARSNDLRAAALYSTNQA
jgi:HK97 family phage major capsid protein